MADVRTHARDAKGSRALLITLTSVAVAFTLASAMSTALLMHRDWDTDRWHGTFQQLVHVGRELSVATWFASALWLLLAFFAFTAGVLAHSKRGYWYAFGAIAAFASMDETATIHEKFYAAGSAIAQYLPFDVFSYRWVIVGVIIAIVVALALLPFVLSLPRPVTIGVIAGGAVFLAGAIGLETVGGHLEGVYGDRSWQLHAIMHVEEFFEYMGVTIAIYALSGMIRLVRRNGSRSLVFTGYRDDVERANLAAGAERLHLDGTTQENASPSIDEDASTPNESPRV